MISSSRVTRRAIAGIWIFSFLMSFIPIQLGMNTTTGLTQNTGDASRCLFELNKPYVLLVSVGTYFTPLVITSTIYVKILIITRRQVKEINGVFLQKSTTIGGEATPNEDALVELREDGRNAFDRLSHPSLSCASDDEPVRQLPSASVAQEKGKARAPVSVVSDRKATVTLASVVLAFAVSWIPYFVLFTVKPFLPDPEVVNAHLDLSFLWLGYVNSAINPFLYAFYNSSFRQGFKRVLCLCRRH